MVTFQVTDITCGKCAQTLKTALSDVQGSEDVAVDIGRKLVQVKGEASTAVLADAIRRAGYKPVEVSGAPASAVPARGGCCGGRRGTEVGMGQAPRASSGSCCS